MEPARCLALVAALSIGAGGCVNKSSSRAFAGLGVVMVTGAVIGRAVYEPSKPHEGETWAHIDSGSVLLGMTLLAGIALTVSAGFGYAIASASEASARKPTPPATADTSQRDREAALAIQAAHASDCAAVERHLLAVRAIDASYVDTVVMHDHLVADCVDEPYLGR